MLTFCVVTGRDTALGFRLAGLEAFAVSSPAEAEEAIDAVLSGGECGLLVVDERLYEGVGDAFRRRLERRGMPVVVPLPMDGRWRSEERGMEYLLRLIRRSIGYHMRLKK